MTLNSAAIAAMIIHGTADRTVPLNQSELMHEALQKAKVSSRLHIIEGAGHGGPAFSEPNIREMQVQFLISELAAKTQR